MIIKSTFSNLPFKLLLILFLFSINKTFAQLKTDAADKVLSKVEIEASFPGGEAAWIKYITRAFSDAEIKFKNSDQGTCRVRFIVDKKGNISDVEALNMKRTKLAKFAVEAISNGPRWKPASQNGKFVVAYREQPISLILSEEPKLKGKKDE